MEGLAVVFFPVLLMFFALSMERVEARLRRLTVEEDDVDKFFEQASAGEVNTFVREGLPHALDVLHVRRRSSRRAPSPTATASQP